MKTKKTIKSRASLARTRCGRAYGMAQRRVVMGIVVAGALWGCVPTARAGGDFWCAENALVNLCAVGDLPTQVIRIPGLVDLLTFETQGSLIERTTAGTAHFTGVVDERTDTNIEFDVDMTFSGRFHKGDGGFPPPGSPVP